MREIGRKLQRGQWAASARKFRHFPSALVVLTLACLFSSAPAAKADSWNFSLTNPSNTTNIGFSFAVGAPSTAYDTYFQLNSPVAWTLNGVAQGTSELSFWNTSVGGGLYLGDNSSGILNLWGPQLYTGPESAPNFVEGTYSFTSCCGQQFNGPFTLTLIDPPDAINAPETSTVMLLGTGLLGMLGLAGYQTRRTRLAPANLA